MSIFHVAPENFLACFSDSVIARQVCMHSVSAWQRYSYTWSIHALVVACQHYLFFASFPYYLASVPGSTSQHLEAIPPAGHVSLSYHLGSLAGALCLSLSPPPPPPCPHRSHYLGAGCGTHYRLPRHPGHDHGTCICLTKAKGTHR